MENPAPHYDPIDLGWEKLDEIGYPNAMGLFWRKPDGQGALYGLLATNDHLNQNGLNQNGRVHGATIPGLVDHALGHTARDFGVNQLKATVQLDTQFIHSPAAGDFLVAQGFLVRQTRSILFMHCDITAGEKLVATANGLWKLLGIN